jgi:hypothetical protein
MKPGKPVLILSFLLIFLSLSSGFSEDTTLNGGEEGLDLIQTYVSNTVPGTTDGELQTLQTLASCYVLDSPNTVGGCISEYGDEMPVALTEVLPEFGETPEDPDEPEDQPIEDSYLEFNDAEVASETVSADGEGLNVDFSFDRDSANRNDVEAEIGLYIDESSSPVKTFDVPDRDETQTVSANWQTIWDELGESETDATAQLVLQEKTEGDYRWNRDSIDAGEFTIERCSNFESNVNDNWELTYEPDNEQRCLDRVNAGENADGSHGFLIRSNQGGVGGSVELRRVFRDTQGTERLTFDLNRLQDSSQIRTSDLEVRHFKGGEEGNGWNTVLEGEVYNLESQSLELDFTEALSGTHPYNIVEITVENDQLSSNEEILEIEGDYSFEQYPEDGPGTCQPGQTWCDGISQEGQCIDDENYEPGLC